jgi:hypothetical protein
MEIKQTALDILFEEIKESTAVMPNALFTYFKMVYDKAKEIEKKQAIDLIKNTAMYAAASQHDEEIGTMTHEDIYNNYYNN